jgi:hypothetical protein
MGRYLLQADQQDTGETRHESSLQMTFVPARLFSHLQRDVSFPDIQDYPPQD